MERLFLLIITGLSGAGKSTALSRLEDNGYFCADNIPSLMLPEFIKQCENATPAILRAAVGVDGRANAFGLPVLDFIGVPDKLNADYRIVFLDCKDEILRRRYIETRRRHPFAKDGDVAAGIAYERALLQAVRENAHIVIDTSALTPAMLYKSLEDAVSIRPKGQPDVLVTSFGFKRGMPVDADIVLDMRFLPNPFYSSELRPLSGLDEPVREFCLSDPQAAPFFDAVERMLISTLPGFFAQGKQRVMVAFGCTGGRHRSVAAAEEIKRRLDPRFCARCHHRDLEEEAESISGRFG